MIRQLEILGLFRKAYTIPEWMGTTVRGVFGYALRQLICNKPIKRCRYCRVKHICPYQVIFETTATLFDRQTIGKKLSGITKPYTLSNIKMLDRYRFRFYLTLIGEYAKSQEKLFMAVLDKMGKMGLGRCKKTNERRYFDILKVSVVNFIRDSVEVIYTPNDGYFPKNGKRDNDLFEEDINYQAQKYFEKKPAVLRIDFKSPVMLVKDGHTTKSLEFSLIIKNIMRKISFVRAYYLNKKPLEVNYIKEINALSDRIELENSQLTQKWFNKYSFERRQWERIGPFMAGFLLYKIPKEIYSSSIAKDLFEILLWGRVLHVGKLATTGAGEFEFTVF